jgi:hypothetical protein
MCLIQRRFLDTGVVAVRLARAVSMSTRTTAASVECMEHADGTRGRDYAFKHIFSLWGLPGVYSTIRCLCYKTNELKKREKEGNRLR